MIDGKFWQASFFLVHYLLDKHNVNKYTLLKIRIKLNKLYHFFVFHSPYGHQFGFVRRQSDISLFYYSVPYSFIYAMMSGS
jgi:hypothetical protein